MGRDASFLGRGWPFPLRLGDKRRQTYLSGDEKIRQSILLILSTAPGERIMRPEFGCGIHNLYFEANSSVLRATTQSRVREALVRWEPRIDVVDVRVEMPQGARNYLLIHIDYRIRINNAFYNLVYPFYVNEGPG